MQIKQLTLTQVRVFEQAVFNFQPGMNLLVGINGAGKSTVLDSLCIILSRALPKLTVSRSKASDFETNDISVNRGALTAELKFDATNISFTYLRHLPREKYGDKVFRLTEQSMENLRKEGLSEDILEGLKSLEYKEFLNEEEFFKAVERKIGEEATNTYKKSILKEVSKSTDYQPAHHVDRQTRIKRRREQQQIYDSANPDKLTPDDKSILKHLKTASEQPLAVYFSTRRSSPSMAASSKQSIAGGQKAAFADALNHRELRVREFAEWWLTRQELAKEDASYLRYISVLQNAITTFLDTCTNLRAVNDPEVTLLIDKDSKTLDVRQLSDGERGVLVIVLDLARRLAQANPKLDDPLKDGKAVVLIDELDLHLHPSWQRTIVDNLTRTFPSCQFIATTHSPQIVGEVAPEQIILIKDGKTTRPDQSLGMDTNWILRYLMGVEERDTETQQQLKNIETLIENDEYDEATAAIDVLRSKIGEFPYLVRLQTRIDRIQFLGE